MVEQNTRQIRTRMNLRNPNLWPQRHIWRLALKYLKPKLCQQRQRESHVALDVLIPAIDKDLVTLPYVIDGVKDNIRHPIGEISIIAPRSSNILRVCQEKGCVFVDEDSVLPITKKDVNYICTDGHDRSGWLFQQFLKWSGDKLARQPHYLVVDADTVFIRPQILIVNDRVVFNCSDEYHLPYFDIYQALLNEKPRCPVSFTSHHMLFEKTKLKELKARIEKESRLTWCEAIIKHIDRKTLSGHSDYETYGQFVFNHYRNEIALEYWFNLSLKQCEIGRIRELTELYRNRFKSLSFHSYND
jgi:Family of unknown function (DUF6492)